MPTVCTTMRTLQQTPLPLVKTNKKQSSIFAYLPSPSNNLHTVAKIQFILHLWFFCVQGPKENTTPQHLAPWKETPQLINRQHTHGTKTNERVLWRESDRAEEREL